MGEREYLAGGGKRRLRNGRRDFPALEGSKWASVLLEAAIKMAT